jgi:hypothetical protein
MDILDDVFDDMINDECKRFIRSVRQENARSNRRLYKILLVIKGKSFVDSLKRLAMQKGGLPKIRISRQPKGIRMKDNRWSAIPEIWIDQKQSVERGATGHIYVQVKENRWVKFPY